MGAAHVRRWVWGDDPTRLREVVDRGGVLVVPTESSYALAADPCNRTAVDAVFRIKRRPADQPLPVILGSVEMISNLGLRMPQEGLGGLEKLWPGPLSILLPCTTEIPAAGASGRLAVRIPGHTRLVTLLGDLDRALTASSANRSGRPPILDPGEARDLVDGEDAMIVDDGVQPGGRPSTLVALERHGAVILRAGRFGEDELAAVAPRLFSAAPVEIPVEKSR